MGKEKSPEKKAWFLVLCWTWADKTELIMLDLELINIAEYSLLLKSWRERNDSKSIESNPDR